MFVGVGDAAGHLMDLFKEYSGEENNPSLKGCPTFLKGSSRLSHKDVFTLKVAKNGYLQNLL